jgi:hypothetical protein
MAMFLFFIYVFLFMLSLARSIVGNVQHFSSPSPSKSKSKFNPKCKADFSYAEAKRQQAMQKCHGTAPLLFHLIVRPQGAAMTPNMYVQYIYTRIED